MDYLVKAFIFVPFMGLVYLFIDYFKGLLTNSINGLPYSSIMCQFGIFDGLSFFFSILIGAFIAKQILSFLK